jgi:hypothetical protein
VRIGVRVYWSAWVELLFSISKLLYCAVDIRSEHNDPHPNRYSFEAMAKCRIILLVPSKSNF